MGERTAVYRFHDKAGTVIYVGISNNPVVRWQAHAADKPWWSDVVTREIEWFPTRQEAEREEARLIGALAPLWNRAPGMPDPALSVNLTKARKRKGWEPSEEMLALFARHEGQKAALGATRDELEALIIAEMMAGVSAVRMAKFLPWEAPSFQRIGKKGGVPPLREATVVSRNRAVQLPAQDTS